MAAAEAGHSLLPWDEAMIHAAGNSATKGGGLPQGAVAAVHCLTGRDEPLQQRVYGALGANLDQHVVVASPGGHLWKEDVNEQELVQQLSHGAVVVERSAFEQWPVTELPHLPKRGTRKRSIRQHSDLLSSPKAVAVPSSRAPASRLRLAAK